VIDLNSAMPLYRGYPGNIFSSLQPVSADPPSGIPPESSFGQQSGSHSQHSPREAREPLSFSHLSGQEKRSGQPAMNRSKQAGMGIKPVIVLLVGLALASHLALYGLMRFVTVVLPAE